MRVQQPLVSALPGMLEQSLFRRRTTGKIRVSKTPHREGPDPILRCQHLGTDVTFYTSRWNFAWAIGRRPSPPV